MIVASLVSAVWIAGTALQAPASPVESPRRITLENGVVVEGPTSVGPDGSLIVDLGFDLLIVRPESVASSEPLTVGADVAPIALDLPDESEVAPTPEPTPTSDGDEVPADTADADDTDGGSVGPARLWRPADSTEVIPLDDAVRQVAEAVVLVRSKVGLGSGFVIHEEGYLVTNDHVIEGSNELTVIVFRQATDGLEKAEYKKVRIVATAELLDLALLKMETDGEKFVTVPLGDSHAVRQGEPVFAVGNPMGLERSLSEGIVGLRSRLLSGQSYVQTTAALSPGNSGGPLFDRRGAVIGVNSLKIVAAGAEGLSFSIPINRVMAFLDDQEAYAFDPLNPNTGYRYYAPPEQPEKDAMEEGR